MVLICISLMTRLVSDIEHLFMYLLAIYVSALEKCLFGSSAPFKIKLFDFLLLSCMNSLYILNSNPLSDM